MNLSYLPNILIVVGVCVASALAAELISWVLVYRRPAYIRLKSQIERSSKKLEKKRSEKQQQAGASSNSGKADKIVKRLESELKKANMMMQAQQMRSNFALMAVMMSLMYYMNSAYAGVVVAKLPFTPFGFLQGLSHRNLEGEVFTDCSMIFLYVVTGMGIRPNLKKLLGHEAPKSADVGSIFDIPDDPNSTFK